MSEKNYPPLPAAAWRASTIRTTEDAYTEAQMRAYVDADRAQRLPLTDVQVLGELMKIFPDAARLPLGWLKFARAIEATHGIGGHVVNKGETK